MIKRKVLITALLLGGLGVQAQTSQQWRDSLAVLNKQISQNVYSSDLYLKKAAVNIELQQWEYAHETYSEVLRRDPYNLAALYYRAFVNGKMRRYDLAADDYEVFLNIAPTHMDARLGLAYTLIKRDKRMEALDQYGIVIEQHPDSALGYASRACLEEDMKRYETALYDWEKAIELSPDDNDYLFSKANLLLKMNRKGEARKCIDELMRRGVTRGELNDLLKECK